MASAGSTTQGFTAIMDFVVKFILHPVDPKAHTHLNNLYSDCIDRPGRLFKDATTMTELEDDQTLIPMIRKIIAEEIVGITNASQTQDQGMITPIINAAALFVDAGVGPLRRLSKSSMTRALQSAVGAVRTHIEIRVATSHIYFDVSAGPLNYLDWSKMSTTAPPVPAPVPGPPTAAEIAQAVAGAMPQPMTAQTLASALASAFPAGGPQAQSAGPVPMQSASSITTGSVIFSFNPGAFPSDVRTRYTNKMQKGLITGSTVAAPFSTGNRYHLQDTDKIVLADGTLFVMQVPNEKGLMKASVYCEENTHSGIRAWYETFTQACHDYGFYAHPLWCFRANRGGERGFSIGGDPDDDLPTRMEIPVLKMSNPIFRLLSKREMFPKNSRLPAIVRSCNGDGYKAIKAVLFKSHPAFHDQPSTLIASYPRQRDLGLLEYYKLFTDFLQLRAYIANITGSLDDENEYNIFLKNAKYSEYLNRVTRDERRLSSLVHKYQGTQLIETLEKFLQAPDSPMLKADRFRSKQFKPLGQGHRPPRQVPVQAVGYITDSGSDGAEESTGPDPKDVHEEPTTVELYSIKVPDDDSAKELYHEYCASVHKISAKPGAANQQPCIVCGGSHRFDNCSVLANTAFLRSHYIRYCQHLRRDAAARAQEFPEVKGPPAKTAPLRFVDTGAYHAIAPDSDSDYDTDEDFQQGRV